MINHLADFLAYFVFFLLALLNVPLISRKVLAIKCTLSTHSVRTNVLSVLAAVCGLTKKRPLMHSKALSSDGSRSIIAALQTSQVNAM